jgi:hypothetical protein
MKRQLAATLILAAGAALADGGFTLSAWICPRTLSPEAPIIVRTADAENRGDGFGLFLGADGSLRAYARSATDAANIAAGAAPTEGEWSHVCLAYDGRITRLYLGGVAQGVATNGAGNAESTGEVFIGDDGLRVFDGEIAAVDFFTGALSAADVAFLARGADGKAPNAARAATATAKTSAPHSVADAKSAQAAALAERLRNLGRVSDRCRTPAKPLLKVHTPLE